MMESNMKSRSTYRRATRLRGTLALLTCASLLAIAAAARAQTGRMSIEGRGGMTFPTGDFNGLSGAGSGFAAGLDALYNIIDPLSVYAGFSRDEFDGGFSSMGGQAGLKFMPKRYGTVLPWVTGGVLGQRLDVSGAQSGLELGFEAGAGADFELTPMFSLTPGVRYRAYDAGIGAGQVSPRYFVATIAAHLHVR